MTLGRVGWGWWVVGGCGVILEFLGMFTVGGGVMFTGWGWWVVVGTG